MAVLSLLANCKSVKTIYKKEVKQRLKAEDDSHVLTNDDIKHLPVSVKKYLEYCGWVGKKVPKNGRLVFNGKFKLKQDKKFIRIKSEQYNFFEQPSRFFYIKNWMIGGRDKYQNHKGNMLIKLFKRFKVGDVKGDFMDKSALVTYLNDICLVFPFALAQNNISWQEIDSRTAKATIKDGDLSVSGVLYFNEKGQLINFVSDDRYYAPTAGEAKLVKWSTPITSYKNVNGINLVGAANAVWHFKKGDFVYAKFDVKEIDYNILNFK